MSPFCYKVHWFKKFEYKESREAIASKKFLATYKKLSPIRKYTHTWTIYIQTKLDVSGDALGRISIETRNKLLS